MENLDIAKEKMMPRLRFRKITSVKNLYVPLLCVSFALFASESLAGELKGAGAGSCGEWIEDRKANTWFSTIHWVQGYLSAYNYYVYKGKDSNGVFGRVDGKALAVWLDNYCESNPLKSPASGMTKLVQELEQQQR